MADKPLMTIETIYHELFKDEASNHFPSESIDEVIPGKLFLGNRNAALSLETLRSRGITHVLNMAQGEGDYRVETDGSFYADDGITFMGVGAEDAFFYDIAAHFEDTSDYVDKALQNGGRVFVHCREGYSRAPTIVCAFLMLKKRLGLLAALRLISDKRKVCPNLGFMEQLIELDARLNSDPASQMLDQ